MQVDKLIQLGDSKVGESVNVSGLLMVTADNESFLAVDSDSYRRGKRISIRDGNVVATHIMKSQIPPLGGGPFYAIVECTVSGTLQRSLDRFELVDIKSCIAKHGDVVVDVPFPSEPV